jgi:hypothetical protein
MFPLVFIHRYHINILLSIPSNSRYVFQLSTRSIEPSFGLLFGDKLRDMGVATTGASVIMSTLDATVNFSGVYVTLFHTSCHL